MHIRRFKPDDAQKVSELIIQNLRQVIIRDYSSEVIEKLVLECAPKHIINDSQCQYMLICMLENELVGTATLDRDRVRNVFVDVKQHRKGIGQHLMAAIENHARQQHLSKIYLLASISAYQFYEKLGYKIVDRFENDLDGIPLLVIKMEKEWSENFYE